MQHDKNLHKHLMNLYLREIIRSDDPELLQGRGRRGSSPVEVRAASHRVVAEIFLGFLVAKVLQGIRPQQVAHGPESRRLLEPIQLSMKKHKCKLQILHRQEHTSPSKLALASYLFNVV